MIGISERLYPHEKNSLLFGIDKCQGSVCSSGGALSREVFPLEVHNPRLALT